MKTFRAVIAWVHVRRDFSRRFYLLQTTPIESTDKSTPAIFGDYIDIYDIQRAVEDEATVSIYYEGRLALLELEESERLRIDTEFEEVTEGEEQTVKDKLKSKW